MIQTHWSLFKALDYTAGNQPAIIQDNSIIDQAKFFSIVHFFSDTQLLSLIHWDGFKLLGNVMFGYINSNWATL